jgi:NADPH-dependent 2,4-dienoyl-CoA reductase/sulfur reductase-like enzyme
MDHPARFDRALGSIMVRCMDLELAKTGISEREANRAGMPNQTNIVKTLSHARYYPDASELTIKLCYRPEDHVLLGAQIMGRKEAALRIDAFAVAIDRKMTTEELGYADFGYAPPFSGAWDAVQIAANASK